MASWAVAYRVTSAPVGLLIGDVAPLRAQPTMLETECVYILSLNSLVMDLTTLITESSYWPRNVGGTLSVFSHAGVAASRNKQKFLFFELSSLFIMRGGGVEILAVTRKVVDSCYPDYFCHQEYCNWKVACSTLVILQRSMYNPLKLFVRTLLLMKPGGVGSCIYLVKFKWKFLRFSLKVWIRAVLLRKFKEAQKQWLLILEKLYLYVKNGSSNPWYHTYSRHPVNKYCFFQPWRICHSSTNCKDLQNISFRLWESQNLLLILMNNQQILIMQLCSSPQLYRASEHLSAHYFGLTASILS